MITVTLKQIRTGMPCDDEFGNLQSHLRCVGLGVKGVDAQIPLSDIFHSNGFDVALSLMKDCVDPYICRLFSADCADRVLHLFEDYFPGDSAPMDAIAVARRKDATNEELEFAGRAAWGSVDDDVSSPSTVSAAGISGCSAAAATRGDIVAAISTAELAAAYNAFALSKSKMNAIIAFYRARSAERAAQKRRFLQYCDHGIVTSFLSWEGG